MEDKIKCIEELLAKWEASLKSAQDENRNNTEIECCGGVSALEEAIRILKEPSNTKLQTDSKRCDLCGSYEEVYPMMEFCPSCHRALNR